jgi:AcrR family transcriptional regulator
MNNDEILSRGEQTRTTILEAAHDLFIKQGYHGTSMRQIARQAGIALGGLYNHFSSKEEVFEAVFFTYHPYHEVLPLVRDAQGDNLEQIIRNAARAMVEVVEGRPDFMNLMFIELVEFKSAHSQKLFTEIAPSGIEIVQRLQKIDPSQLRLIPAPILLRSFLGLFFSYYLTEIVFASAAPPEFRKDAMDHFVNIYLHGILTDKTAESGSTTP